MLSATRLADGDLARLLLGNLLVLFVEVLAFRLVTAPLILHFGNGGGDTHGSATFSTKTEIAPLTCGTNGLLIGRDLQSKRLLRYDGPTQLLTMAPTRSGKGVGTIIPNLPTADSSIICIDPKGENARITSRARQQFGPVHILDPFAITGLTSAAFNLLDPTLSAWILPKTSARLLMRLSPMSQAPAARCIGMKKPKRSLPACCL